MTPRIRRALSFLAFVSITFVARSAAQDAFDPLEGVWSGKVTSPQGSVDVAFRFTRRDDLHEAAFDIPELFIHDVALGPVDERDEHVRIQLLELELHREGAKLIGTFALSHLPIELAHGGSFAPKPPDPIDPVGPEPRWTHVLGAPTWGSVVARDGTLYIGAENGEMSAVSATDGQSIWTAKGFARIDGSSLATDDALFFVDGASVLHALSRANGEERWKFELHDRALAGHPVPDNETFNRRTATPLAVGGALYVGSSDGGFYAIDAQSGKKLWRSEVRAPVHAEAALIGSDRLIFGTMDGSLVTLELAGGRELARTKLGGAIVSRPLVVADRTIVGTRDYWLVGLAPDGHAVWKDSFWMSWVESTPVQVDGVGYVGSSDLRRVTAFEPATGIARWASDVRGMAWGTPVVGARTIYIGTAAQSGVIIAHSGGITALDRKTGAMRWRRVTKPAAGAPIWGYVGSLASDGKLVFAAGLDGQLVAFAVE